MTSLGSPTPVDVAFRNCARAYYLSGIIARLEPAIPALQLETLISETDPSDVSIEAKLRQPSAVTWRTSAPDQYGSEFRRSITPRPHECRGKWWFLSLGDCDGRSWLGVKPSPLCCGGNFRAVSRSSSPPSKSSRDSSIVIYCPMTINNLVA